MVVASNDMMIIIVPIAFADGVSILRIIPQTNVGNGVVRASRLEAGRAVA
jgi:hypothetical protein